MRYQPEPADTAVSQSYAATFPVVSVVVSTFQRAELVGRLLKGLQEQSLQEPFEVVVVDDGSSDGTWAVLTAFLAQTALAMKIARLAQNSGAGTGRDTGVALSRAPIVAFTDDDCIPTPGWLEALSLPLRQTDPPPPVVVQGKTLPWDEDEGGAGAWARTLWVLEPSGLFETCNIAYRRSDLDSVGTFLHRSEAPRSSGARPFGEDAELGWRVISAGSRLVFASEAVIQHRHFPATYREHLRELARRRDFPDLVSRHELGRAMLWHRWFLSPRTAAFDLGLIGLTLLVLARRSRWIALVLPWVWLALPEAVQRGGRHPVIRLVQLAAADGVSFAALVAGSLQSRNLVL